MQIRVLGAAAALALVVPVGLAAPAQAATAAKPFDLNGDGRPELVVGAPYLRVGSVKDAGGVFVLPGSSSGVSTKEKVVSQSTSGIPGTAEAGDAFGYAVASADFDRDGFADLAIGSPGEDVQGDDDSGSVTVVYGSEDGLDTHRTDQLLLPDTGGLGTSLVAADLTGDGYPDLAVGSPDEGNADNPGQDFTPIGVVHVYSGGADGIVATGPSTLIGKGGTGRIGFDVGFGSLLAAGDVSGDGNADLVVGSEGQRFVDEGYPGSVSVCPGTSGGPTGCTQVAQESDFANMSALAVGNVVGTTSSAAEIVVGSYLSSEEDPGYVNIVRLGAGGTTSAQRTEITQSSPGVPGKAEDRDAFGSALAVGDIDRDGHDDLVIGSKYEDEEEGAVAVVRGGTDGYATSGNYSYDQDSKGVPGKSEEGDTFGSSVTLLDHDGDGRLDLSIGASGENGDDGAVTFLKGSGTRFTTDGAKGFSADSLGYAHPADGYFGEVLGTPAARPGLPRRGLPAFLRCTDR